jgi:formate hydrogenlyase subunit 6/NADH:ubiquinone oxidoreductase subunit I
MKSKAPQTSYFGSIGSGTKSMWTGLKLAFKHLFAATEHRTSIGIEDKDYFKQDTGIVTLQYPYESLPVPDNGRYRLHNEIDDCIVCDKCAKVCPVDCIEIEPIKAPEEIGRTSDDTPKRIHAAKFDIDMAKCCFCGLCTTVCPTECLTMTKAYDFSEYDVKDHNYAFAEMTPLEILEARQKQEVAEKEKAEAKAKKEAEAETTAKSVAAQGARPKPVFRPKMKPLTKPANTEDEQDDPKAKALALMKAKAKPAIPKKIEEGATDSSSNPARPKPMMKAKAVINPKPETDQDVEKEAEASAAPKKAKPEFRPKPVIRKPKKDGDS